MRERHKSRKRTPWDNYFNLSPVQSFIKMQYVTRFEERHPVLANSKEEASMVNSFSPQRCPFCGSQSFTKFGFDSNGIQRYKCECGQRFRPTTGTIFDSRKIPISEWIEYCLNIFRYISLNADSWNNRNSISTSKYWLEKLFLVLENYQQMIVLKKKVWLDETYYPVIMREKKLNDNGTLLRGLSRNQICIGVARDKDQTICFVEGIGRPTQERSLQTFCNHIEPGSILIHDKEKTHRQLIEKLSLNSISYDSKVLKGLSDDKNPLNPVNRVHCLLKMFLNAHSGFNREDLQNYLNVYTFAINPPRDPLEKVEKLINLAFTTPKKLRYRDQFL